MPTDKSNLNELMQRAQDMQRKLQDIQKQVAEMKVTGQSGGGLLSIEMNGKYDVTGVTINPNALKEDKSVLEDLIAAAVNDATRKIERNLREKMGGLAGIKLPDDFGDQK